MEGIRRKRILPITTAREVLSERGEWAACAAQKTGPADSRAQIRQAETKYAKQKPSSSAEGRSGRRLGSWAQFFARSISPRLWVEPEGMVTLILLLAAEYLSLNSSVAVGEVFPVEFALPWPIVVEVLETATLYVPGSTPSIWNLPSASTVELPTAMPWAFTNLICTINLFGFVKSVVLVLPTALPPSTRVPVTITPVVLVLSPHPTANRIGLTSNSP